MYDGVYGRKEIGVRVLMGSSSQLRSYAVRSSLSQVQLRGFEVHGQRQCTLGTGIRRGGYDAPFNGSWWSMFECALREDDKFESKRVSTRSAGREAHNL